MSSTSGDVGVEHAPVPAVADRTWLGRRLRLVSRVLALAVAGVLVVDGWLAYDAFFGPADPAVVQDGPDEPAYRDLTIFDEAGSFAGRITVVNPFEEEVNVLVSVEIYDGDRQVGKLVDMVRVPAGSASVLELSGWDDYAAYTDTRVHLSGWRE